MNKKINIFFYLIFLIIFSNCKSNPKENKIISNEKIVVEQKKISKETDHIKQKCYVVVKSPKQINNNIISDFSISLLSQFVEKISEIPPEGIHNNSCVYSVSVGISKKNIIVILSGRKINSVGESPKKGIEGVKESLVRLLYRGLPGENNNICKKYGILLEECPNFKKDGVITKTILNPIINLSGFKKEGKYIGQVLNGIPNGKGKYIRSDGLIYEGEWVKGEPHGSGMIKTSDGENYQGDWINGEKNGKGKLTYSDGIIYEGNFKKNKINGNGIFSFKNNFYCKGTWDGKINGWGRCNYSELPYYYYGKFVDGIKNGIFFVSSSPNLPHKSEGHLFEVGYYKNNITDGFNISISDSISFERHVNGKKMDSVYYNFVKGVEQVVDNGVVRDPNEYEKNRKYLVKSRKTNNKWVEKKYKEYNIVEKLINDSNYLDFYGQYKETKGVFKTMGNYVPHGLVERRYIHINRLFRMVGFVQNNDSEIVGLCFLHNSDFESEVYRKPYMFIGVCNNILKPSIGITFYSNGFIDIGEFNSNDGNRLVDSNQKNVTRLDYNGFILNVWKNRQKTNIDN